MSEPFEAPLEDRGKQDKQKLRPPKEEKSRSLTPLAKGASGFPSRIGTSGMTVLVVRKVEQNSEARCGLRSGRACLRQAGLSDAPTWMRLPFFLEKGNNGCWLLTKCIQRLHF